MPFNSTPDAFRLRPDVVASRGIKRSRGEGAVRRRERRRTRRRTRRRVDGLRPFHVGGDAGVRVGDRRGVPLVRVHDAEAVTTTRATSAADEIFLKSFFRRARRREDVERSRRRRVVIRRAERVRASARLRPLSRRPPDAARGNKKGVYPVPGSNRRPPDSKSGIISSRLTGHAKVNVEFHNSTLSRKRLSRSAKDSFMKLRYFSHF